MIIEIITICKLLLVNPATSAASERFSETENVATFDDDTNKIYLAVNENRKATLIPS